VKYQPMELASCPINPLVVFVAALLLILQQDSLNAQVLPDSNFLNASANADGSINRENNIAQSFYSTAESLITFDVLNQGDTAIAVAARNYLVALSVNSTEELAIQSLMLPVDAQVFAENLGAVIQRQNYDGGIGGYEEFDSDIISTAYALKTFSRAQLTDEIPHRAVSYLLSHQNVDGSWSITDNPNRIKSTALVLNALWLYRHTWQLNGELQRGITYLLDQRGEDSLWVDIEASALALLAILNAATDRSVTRYPDTCIR